MSAPVKWLLLEALLPLFGATIIYALLGVMKWVVMPKSKRVKWTWAAAFDSMGWLYAGAILAVQAGLKGNDTAIYGAHPYVVWLCFLAAIFCVLFLLVAMMARGEDPDWTPPPLMLGFTGLMMAAIIFSGYMIQDAAFTNGANNASHATGQKSGS